MRKALFTGVLVIALMFALSGCMMLEKSATVKVHGPTGPIPFGTSAAFELKITSGTAGGMSDIFGADVKVKKVVWTFTNTSNPSGSFTLETTGEQGNKCSATFDKTTGNYELKAKMISEKDQTYKSSNALTFTVNKGIPVVTVKAYDGGTEITNLNEIRKNQSVKFTITITDENVDSESLKEYQVKWVLKKNGVSYASQDFEKYSTPPDFEVDFLDKGNFTMDIYVKDIFGSDYAYASDVQFSVNTAIPDAPILIEQECGWENDRDYRFVLQAGDDVFYYEFYKKIDGVYQFIGRVFSSQARIGKIDFYERNANKGTFEYKIVAVDGGAESKAAVYNVVIPNRLPPKVKIISPKGLVRNVSSNFYVSWTGGKDPDLVDSLKYHLYIGENSNILEYVGTTADTVFQLNYMLESGKTYWLRVDSDDSSDRVTGDVYSFTFEPDIGSPFFVSVPRADFISKDEWNIIVKTNYGFNNPYGNILGVTTAYEFEFSKYASFPKANTYQTIVYNTVGEKTFLVPKNNKYSEMDKKLMYIRVRAVVTVNNMIIRSNWSTVYRCIP